LLQTNIEYRFGLWFMVFNATFNNISVISCMAVSFIGGRGPGDSMS